ncbi:MAG: NAD(P)H-binding protein, partial [Chloroflexaceae bacterium]|nr:NAD(P)H-binding protein [Chloroflexaceae bacterium]
MKADNNSPLAFVTGATGAVGPALVGQLLDHGYRVRALVRQPYAAALPAPVELVPGDLSDVQKWHTTLQGVDVLFHM